MRMRQLINATLVGGLALVSTGAFSLRSRYKIKERAKHRSEWSGLRNRPLECSHIDHTRNEFYDDPKNGKYITDWEHFALHLCYWTEAHHIGLEHDANQFAIRETYKRVYAFNQANKWSTDPVYMCQMTIRIINKHWDRIFDGNDLPGLREKIHYNVRLFFGLVES